MLSNGRIQDIYIKLIFFILFVSSYFMYILLCIFLSLFYFYCLIIPSTPTPPSPVIQECYCNFPIHKSLLLLSWESQASIFTQLLHKKQIPTVFSPTRLWSFISLLLSLVRRALQNAFSFDTLFHTPNESFPMFLFPFLSSYYTPSCTEIQYFIQFQTSVVGLQYLSSILGSLSQPLHYIY